MKVVSTAVSWRSQSPNEPKLSFDRTNAVSRFTVQVRWFRESPPSLWTLGPPMISSRATTGNHGTASRRTWQLIGLPQTARREKCIDRRNDFVLNSPGTNPACADLEKQHDVQTDRCRDGVAGYLSQQPRIVAFWAGAFPSIGIDAGTPRGYCRRRLRRLGCGHFGTSPGY